MDDMLPDSSVQSPFNDVPIEITVCIGHAKPTVGELLMLAPNAILTLDAMVDDPVSLYVGERLIGKGILEENTEGDSGQLVVKLTEVSDMRGGI